MLVLDLLGCADERADWQLFCSVCVGILENDDEHENEDDDFSTSEFRLNKLRARLSGRFGASVPQPCFDLVRLARKETVYS